MQPPDEMMMDSFLPSMRHLVAHELRARGCSQGRIASLLGVTQASVSMYLSSDRSRAYSTLASLSVSAAEAQEHAKALADQVEAGPQSAIVAIESMWRAILGSGGACGAHRAAHPSLSTCDYCIREYGRKDGAREEALEDVANAVKTIEGSPTFGTIIPEVSVNVARATAESDSPTDVVAVPGRIGRVRGRAKAALPPEAGASIHMSRMLLLVRRKSPDVKACINFRYDSRMAAVLAKLGMKSLRLERRGKTAADDPTVRALDARLRLHVPAFDVVIEPGGGGIEPNAYLYGGSATEVAQRAVEVSRVYSSGEGLDPL